jgi:hypothetical protein
MTTGVAIIKQLAAYLIMTPDRTASCVLSFYAPHASIDMASALPNDLSISSAGIGIASTLHNDLSLLSTTAHRSGYCQLRTKTQPVLYKTK